jgi:CheY-like chemotaxis protein
VGLRVLLIDDDERLFELLARYMGDNDVALSHAADGQRGLAALAAGGYDAVLLDVPQGHVGRLVCFGSVGLSGGCACRFSRICYAPASWCSNRRDRQRY